MAVSSYIREFCPVAASMSVIPILQPMTVETYISNEVEMAISRKVRIALIVSFCLLLVIAVKTVIAFGRYAKAEKSFASVQVGDSRASVIGRMGKPNCHEGKCGVIHFQGKNCKVAWHCIQIA